MKKLKVITVVGTRPEIIRLSRVIDLLRTSSSIEHTLLHTGQNYDYELNEIFFHDLELAPPDRILKVAGGTPSETIGNTLIQVDKVLAEINPDAFLVLGDTNSCLSALSAKKRKIPVFHMEAGNRCFDMRVPEELNRKLVDSIADINLTYSDISREYLISEGFAPDRIIKTGSPMFEVINHYLPKAGKSTIIDKLKLRKREYFLISAHREENIESPVQFNDFTEILRMLDKEYKFPVVVTTHPRTRKKLEESGENFTNNIKFFKPFGYTDYLKLQMNAYAVLSDSGTISEESSILNFHALNIRDAHERPEAMEEGAVMMVGMNLDRVAQALKVLPLQDLANRNFRLVEDYQRPNVSQKVLRIMLSYTDYVMKNVWKK
jgi:UDP-N-acetylglucosamine 2-epimerase (non-hydrolysing)